MTTFERIGVIGAGAWGTALAQACRAGGHDVMLWATLQPQFAQVIEALSKYMVMIDFFTNGMTLKAELCNFLVERKVGVVYVSLTGASAADYEDVYIGGKHETVLQGIRNLAAARKARSARCRQV